MHNSDVRKRRLTELRKLGVIAIRTAHNSPAPEFQSPLLNPVHHRQTLPHFGGPGNNQFGVGGPAHPELSLRSVPENGLISWEI